MKEQIKKLKHGIQVSYDVIYSNQKEAIIPNLLSNQVYIMEAMVKMLEAKETASISSTSQPQN